MDKHGMLTPPYEALIRLLAKSAAVKWLNNQQAQQERDAGNAQNMPLREIQH